MFLVRFKEVSLEFGDHPLLVNADFSIDENERVCLIGRNGAGKSSMLKLITGQYQPDGGELEHRQDIRIRELRQELENESELTVREAITEGLSEIRTLIEDYHRLSHHQLDKQGLLSLENLQQRIDASGGWRIDQQVETIMSQLSLPADRRLLELSGGWRRRVSLGRALVAKPDLLLLDEPTNHLDISTIEWLEHHVRGYAGSVIFVTHDRTFMQKLATRIVEIDRGELTSWPGNYQKYLRDKESALEQEQRQNTLFDKKLATEEMWIRQGIKARRTRNEGRVRALMAMREERAARVKPQKKARITISGSDQSGRKVIAARNVSYAYKDHNLIDGFSLQIMRGDRIGVIGNNGVGKTTLLRLLLGELTPDSGTIKHGTNLEIAYFDQLRRELDPNKTVAETVGKGREYVKINGKDKHVVGYLTDFLFSAKRAMSPVGSLSGGERNRVMLAQLFAQPSNLLVLDEPTNDLDVEMLEVLEDRLLRYDGTLFVVSHDREFLDALVTSTLVFESDGKIVEYLGGYSDWARRERELAQTADPDAASKKSRDHHRPGSRRNAQPKKLTYNEKRELELLPDEIESLEHEVLALQKEISDAGFYTQDPDYIQKLLAVFSDTQRLLDAKIERWGALEEKQHRGRNR